MVDGNGHFVVVLRVGCALAMMIVAGMSGVIGHLGCRGSSRIGWRRPSGEAEDRLRRARPFPLAPVRVHLIQARSISPAIVVPIRTIARNYRRRLGMALGGRAAWRHGGERIALADQPGEFCQRVAGSAVIRIMPLRGLPFGRAEIAVARIGGARKVRTRGSGK
jgi:hypothetical protein